MITALLLLTIYALITAIGAFRRAQAQVKPLKAPIPDLRSTSLSQQINSISSTIDNTVRELESEAAKPQLQPDLDSVQSATAKSNEAPTPGSSNASTLQEQSPSEAPQSSGIAFAPFVPQPEADIPLATSLTVSEVVHPSQSEPQIDLGIAHDAPASEAHEHHVSVVEEVSHLEHDGEKLNQLIQQAHHPDGNVRIVVAAELGAFAAQGNDRAIAILNQLSQDVDPQVRVQAASSLGTRV